MIKTYFLTVLLLFFYSITCLSQSKTDTAITEINQSLDSIGKVTQDLQKALEDSVKNLKQTDSLSYTESINSNYLILDQNIIDSIKVHPKEMLYKEYILGKGPHDLGSKILFGVSLALLIGFLYLGFYLASKTGLCRDESFDTNGQIIKEIHKRPYSYSRVQLFWWTIIILSSYIFFYGITGVLPPLNSTAAMLLGLGVVVYAFGKIIDQHQIKTSPPGKRIQDENTSNDFFTNILSDETGISIHRFQALVFNVIFGIGFISSFIKGIIHQQYPFPDFGDWQLAMLGISSATFLTLKTRENDTTKEGNDASQTKPENQSSGVSNKNGDESNSGQHDR